jgi:hypothetical protein
MANPKLLAVDLSTYSLSADSASAGESLTNLQDYYADTIWRSNTTTKNQTLNVDFGSPIYANMVVIQNYNNPTDVSMTLQGSNNASTWTNLTTFDGLNDPELHEFTLSAYRYFRIVYSGTVPLTSEPYVGNLFIGKAVEFTTTYDFGYKKDNANYVTYESTALDGRIRTSQVYGGRYIWELAFTLQDNTLASDFRTFISTVQGKLKSFYLIDTDGVTVRYVHLTEDYVPITTTHYGRHSVSLKMREQMAER